MLARTCLMLRWNVHCLYCFIYIYIYIYIYTPPWCRVLLEKLTGLQLVKKFPAFYGTRRFITALTSVRHLSLSWANPIQLYIYIYIYIYILMAHKILSKIVANEGCLFKSLHFANTISTFSLLLLSIIERLCDVPAPLRGESGRRIPWVSRHRIFLSSERGLKDLSVAWQVNGLGWKSWTVTGCVLSAPSLHMPTRRS